MSKDNFYEDNEYYKKLKEKLSIEDRQILATIVMQAINSGIDSLYKNLKKNLTK